MILNEKTLRHKPKPTVNNNTSTHIRIDSGLHRLLVQQAKKAHISLHELTEGYLIDGLSKTTQLN